MKTERRADAFSLLDLNELIQATHCVTHRTNDDVDDVCAYDDDDDDEDEDGYDDASWTTTGTTTTSREDDDVGHCES